MDESMMDASTMAGTVSDSRRQTGAGRLLDGPGAAMEVSLPEALTDAATLAWHRYAHALAPWPDARLVARPFPGGLSLAISAPVDALYAAAEANERAWALAWAEVAGQATGDAEAHRDEVERLVADERDEALVALVATAEARDVCCLWDDEFVTLGLGAGGVTFPASALPASGAIDWTAVHDVPTALVTGTNGKSTTVRLLAAMATAAEHVPGVSTTDYVAIGDDVLEAGDFSGPMGARAALRDRRATLGILEVARGGLLRRGVPVPRVPVACITNVAADHLGEYGVTTVEALAEAKFVVAKALPRGGVLVLSADDPMSVAEHDRQRARLDARGVTVAWACLDPAEARLDGASVAVSLVDGWIAVRRARGGWTRLVAVEEVPSTAGGAARHNVRNALTAVATAGALGLPDGAIVAGLRAFRGDATDNPGRANVTDVHGATVVVDYAHNAHGLTALTHFVSQFPAKRRLVLLSSAGDRSDADIRGLAEAARAFGAERTLLADLPTYLRGRSPGDVPEILAQASSDAGALDVSTFPDPPSAVREALAWARPGDVLLLIALSHRDEVAGLVRQAAA